MIEFAIAYTIVALAFIFRTAWKEAGANESR
jgi:hypothetical protein